MYRETSRLLLYGGIGEDSVLLRLAGIFEDREARACDKPALVRRLYAEARRLMDLAAEYGFQGNLWRHCLALLLATDENAFSLACERAGAGGGTLDRLAREDIAAFKRLFDFDFGPIEADLGVDCFSALADYRAVPGRTQALRRRAGEAVQALSDAIGAAADEDAAFDAVAAWYRDHGVGALGLNRAFCVRETAAGAALVPVDGGDGAVLDDLIGYEAQKAELRANTEAFVAGRSCNNMLLYGDAGTGKSTCAKALLNAYAERGLRMVQLYKHQLHLLSEVVAQLRRRNYRFVVFIDDLSFEEHEVEYKYLKAVIEGGVEARPENVLICATSNRRHLIRETWGDRADMEHRDDVHRSDTLEEKLSLAARFGCAVSFAAPDRRLYHDIVKGLARRCEGLDIDEARLIYLANRWELRHGGVSGRTARQFVDDLAGVIREDAESL